MKRPTVIETLAFLGLTLTGIRSDKSGATPLAESGELTHLTSFGQHADVLDSRGFGKVIVQTGTRSDFEPVDTVFTLKTQKNEFQPAPHQRGNQIP